MARWADPRVWGLVLCGVVGCAAPQKHARSESDRTVVDRMDRDWDPDQESWSAGETSDTPSANADRVDMRDVKAGNSSSGTRGGERGGARDQPSGYEMTFNDCNVLAGHYYRVIRQEESGKIPDGLKPAQRAPAERAVEESAQKGKDQWLDQCSGLVGTAYQRSWLTCAMKSTSVKGFTDCVTGEGSATE